MKKTVLIFAALFGMTSVILGAFGAHAFKEILSEEKLQSFETGVKYQMYSSLLLLILGFAFKFKSKLEFRAAFLMIAGTLLFSLSIYFLSFSEHWGISLKWLGPITPLGGVLMILGWCMLLLSFWKGKYSD